jgi:hypothetical protein
MRVAAAVLMMLFTAGSTTPVREVIGRVADAQGNAVASATVRIRFDSTFRIVSAGADGRFRTTIETSSPAVEASISARGFEPRRRTLVFSRNVADAGTIVLTAERGLTLETLTLIVSPDGSTQSLDVFVGNTARASVDVVTLRLHARLLRRTSCLDATPAVEFVVTEKAWAGAVAATVNVAERKNADATAARGVFARLGCGQRELKLAIPYSMNVAPGEREKVRVTIPRTLRGSGGEAETVELDRYAVVELTAEGVGGRAATASLIDTNAP